MYKKKLPSIDIIAKELYPIKHKLIIKCLFDAQAECKCGKWFYCYTGELSEKEIRKEYKKHLENNKIY